MTPEKFKEVVNEMFTECCDLLSLKEKDYSDGRDRLIQFKEAAALKQEQPLDALVGMMAKHTTKLYTMLSASRQGELFVQYDENQWKEVIYDHINYLFLLKALLIDERLI